MDRICAFVAELATMAAPPATFNPYSGDSEGAAARRANLTLYLTRMAERRPRMLLVGEAPGYRGCRVTGVPFTSEAILLDEPSPFGLFGATAGFRAAAGTNVPRREATASTLWAVLVGLGCLPLLWNAFPFHPHRPDDAASNRAPTTRETAVGHAAVSRLLALYEIEQVVAVGNKAAAALARWRIDAAQARHPSHGGKAGFTRDLASAMLPID